MNSILIKLLLSPFIFFSGNRILKKAKFLEEQGRYKEACYEYGIVLLNTIVLNPNAIRDSITVLWEKYGPFNFDEGIELDKNDSCDQAGHAAVKSIIGEIVRGQKLRK